MNPTRSLTKYPSLLFVLMVVLFGAGTAMSQSTDETHPTMVAGFPVTGSLGTGTYYYSVPANAGRANAVLEFTPPDTGGSMSVSLSGPDCCSAEAYVGGDSGGPTPVRQTASFDIRSRQTLLVTVYAAVASGSTIRFNLTLGGSIGVAPGPTATPTPTPEPVPTLPTSVCTDLAASSLISVYGPGATKTIRAYIQNPNTRDFRSVADRQWVELTYGAKATFVRLARVPFTEVLAGGRFTVTATHTPPEPNPAYTVRIVYSPLNRTDSITTNDDCNRANDSARSVPLGILTER